MKPAADHAPLAATELAARRSLTLLTVVFAFVVLGYLGSGIHFVKPGESALLLRFGRLQPEVHGPGLLIAFPAPIDRVIRFVTGAPRELTLDAWLARDIARSTQNETDFGPLRHVLDPARDGYTLTGDANIVQGSFSLRYQIVDPVRFFSVSNEPEAALAALFHQSAARTLARVAIDDVIPSGLASFRDLTLENLHERLARLDLGIALGGLEIRELLPPKPVLPAFQDVNSAKVEGQTYVEEARAYQARSREMAASEAATLRTRATAEAAALLTRAEGERTAFLTLLAAYQEAPPDFRARLLAEMREEVLPRLHQTALAPAVSGAQLLLRPQTADAR
jgi:membrane protease subunit HflK